MRVTRREFLGCAAAAVPLGWRAGRLSATPVTRPARIILDLQRRCSLRESLAGYQAVLGSHVLWVGATAPSGCGLLIVPAAVELTPLEVRAITGCLRAGGSVILESGGAFASETEFRAHRAMLRDSWDIRVESPVDLWPVAAASGIPYVDFTWPITTKIRDFSRAVPLRSRGGKVIGRVNGLPVALECSSGRGTLIVLGSPLGPALWAGDAEAKRWLQVALAM